MQFNLSTYLQDETKQNALMEHLHQTLQIRDYLEIDPQFHRNRLYLQICGNDEIEYNLAREIHKFFANDDIDIMDYTLQCHTEYNTDQDIFTTGMEFTFIDAKN